MGRTVRAWNLRGTELTVICMLSTLHSVLKLSPFACRYFFCSSFYPIMCVCLWFYVPEALQQHLGWPLPWSQSPWLTPMGLTECCNQQICSLQQQSSALIPHACMYLQLHADVVQIRLQPSCPQPLMTKTIWHHALWITEKHCCVNIRVIDRKHMFTAISRSLKLLPVSKWELKAKLGLKNAEDMTATWRAKTILLVALQKVSTPSGKRVDDRVKNGFLTQVRSLFRWKRWCAAFSYRHQKSPPSSPSPSPSDLNEDGDGRCHLNSSEFGIPNFYWILPADSAHGRAVCNLFCA